MDAFKIQIFRLIRKNIYIYALLIIGIFFILPILHSGFYLSHDGFAHVARFAAYYKSFIDGQIIPRWAGDLNARYGTPLFIFFYPLPGVLASLIHLFGISFENIFKILVILSFLLPPIFLFIWLRKLAKEEYAFTAAAIYLMIPYRFLDTYARGDIGELVSFIFIPLVFLYIDKTIREKKILPVILGGIFFALFILAHNGMALIFAPVFFLYVLFFSTGKIKNYIYPLLIIFIGIGLSAFFSIPSVLEGKFTMAKIVFSKLYLDNFITPWKLIYSNWGFSPDVNAKDGLSPQVGIFYATIPFLAILFFNKINAKKQILFWMFIFVSAIFITTPYSKFVWDHVPILGLLGYPWRFTALTGFSACLIIFYLLPLIKRRIFLFLIILIFVVISLPFARVYKYVPAKSDNFYLNYLGTTDYSLRTDTIWTAGEFSVPPKNPIEIIGGQGTAYNIYKNSVIHTYDVNAKTNMSILDNTAYFPGWKVEVDGLRTPIQFQDMNHRGLITFSVPSGKHKVEVVFEETPVRLFSDIISLLFLISLILMLFFRSKIDKFINK